MQHLEDDHPSTAVEAFAAAVALDPEHGQAWYCKGIVHRQLEEYEAAIEAYEQSAKFAGENAALPLFNLGNLYQELGEMLQAARCFRQATEADPTMADAWINLGRILDDSGEHAAAIKCYDVALQIEPEDVMAWSNRGNSLRSLKRFEESLESYRKALQLDSEDFAARIGIGACLVECGQPKEGLDALQSALDATPHPMAMFELATALGKTDRYDEAVSMFDTLIENEFVSAEVWNNRAECLAQLERIDDALESFDRGIEFDDQFAPAWFGKARVLVNAERIDAARPVVEQYLTLIDEAERQNPAVRALLQLCGVET
jgi:tetratricopeptide (TPR) repeat protein